MDYLVDTNVLLRFAIRTHPEHEIASRAAQKLLSDGDQLFLTPQNCIEFWNVITRPANRNGFGFLPQDAEQFLHEIEQSFTVLSDVPVIYSYWRQIVVRFRVSGVQVHDARIVAAMMAHSIPSILTFNTIDFTRYSSVGITAVAPSSIAV